MKIELWSDEDTMFTVYWALGRAGLSDVQITDAINQMQNAGIRFGEVMP